MVTATETAITTVSEVRALSREEAAQGLAVHLEGVVIGEAEPDGIAFVLLDESDGLYLHGPPEHVARLQRGDRIEIEGITDPGGFAPFVIVHQISHRGEAPIPEPIRVNVEDLYGGGLDGQWVEVIGVVRTCRPLFPTELPTVPKKLAALRRPSTGDDGKTGKTRMTLAAGGQRLVVQFNAVLDPAALIDAEVRLRGACFNQHNINRQFLGPLLLVPRGVGLEIIAPPPTDPFESPPQPVTSLLQFSPGADLRHRVHVRGVVTHFVPGEVVWIKDGDRGLMVRTEQRDALALGDTIDVIGFPELGAFSPSLADSSYRLIRPGRAPDPFVLGNQGDILQREQALVTLAAVLVEKRYVQDAIAFWFDWNGQGVRATLAWDDATESPPRTPEAKSVVRVTGICSFVSENARPVSGVIQPGAFQILLRSPEDLEVLKPPPWWTAERIVWVLSGFLVLALGTVAAVMLASRRRLKEQEHRRAMTETEFSAILNERNRVAREIHDTLSQSLGAISIQLELARNHAAEISAEGRNHLGTAHKLARGALAEARDSIWNMRSQVLERCDLGEALEGILMRLTEGTGVTPHMRVEGSSRRLPPVVENNLLRIGQEAITNASKHAKPTRIDVSLAFDRRVVRLTVDDDGVGFSGRPKEGEGRRGFGLVGIRERADLLGGTVDIKSEPGRGTRVFVSLSV